MTFVSRIKTVRNHPWLAPTSRTWAGIAAAVALAGFLSAVQTGVNGSMHPYATDVGEIQNALPRWGLIHRSGYPLYTAMGSTFVTVLRWVGIEPAAGASLFSALWGAIVVAMIAVLAQDLGATGPAAALGALVVGFSTSMWVFASIAEVHTLTLVFSVGILIYALRYGRTGARRDLLLLALFSSQGVMHQRSVVLLAPAALVLVSRQLRALWRNVLPATGIALLAPLTYLYMPLRVWTGATWVFGSPGTWEGFWEMFFDNRGERVFALNASTEEWMSRFVLTGQILADDMFLPLLVLGLLGLLLLMPKPGRARDVIGMTLAWGTNMLLTLFIWKNRVGDAQLAAKLPIIVLAGVGLAVLLDWLRRRSHLAGYFASGALALVLLVWVGRTRPVVLSVTRDPTSEEVIATAERISAAPDGPPMALAASWGMDYWALAYAQEGRGLLQGVRVVDHNADFDEILDRGERLLVLGKTLYVLDVSWWEERLGPLYLASAVPGVVELSRSAPYEPGEVPGDLNYDLENGVLIRTTEMAWTADDQLLVTIYWQATHELQDHSVAVHLVAHEPLRSPEDIISQADAVHPVDGWYPMSRWQVGEIVRDCYLIFVPEGSAPAAVRISLYRSDPQAGFVSSPWLWQDLPPRGS
jgi:hypothetical protein